ncbi:RICIN domain-containing protein [Streptomyces mexicanus]|uniref:RICIN domain-containing protein n=1 Tax=Streptomyces mexicanus TaxID=178566 RepID=UPI00365EDB9D
MNLATQRCLDDSGPFNIRTFSCNSQSYYDGYQKWYYHQYNDGTERLMNASTALCMRDFGNGVVGHATCDESKWESWYHTYEGNGLVFRNQATGMCLDDSDAYGLRTFPCNGLPYQKW